ncbi:MAG TPA: hypothetical protein VF533_25230 [Solirubrobacteraceae bacterium]
MAAGRDNYAAALRITLRNTAAAYGYALTIGSTVAILIRLHGRPEIGEIFGFAMGGLIAFVLLEVGLAALHGHDGRTPEHAFPFAGALNVFSVPAALGVVTGLAHLTEGWLVWALGPLAATAIYMLAVAVQVTLVDTVRRRADR